MGKVMIWNVEDGLPITSEPVDAEKVNSVISEFKSRFRHQGYYFTTRMQRISVDELRFKITDEDEFLDTLGDN